MYSKLETNAFWKLLWLWNEDSKSLNFLFVGDVKKKNEDWLGLKSQPQGQSIKGRLQKIILHSDKISFSTNIPD